MGFSHHWETSETIDRATWRRICLDGEQLLRAYPGPGGLCAALHLPNRPAVMHRSVISFNGSDGYACEDFQMMPFPSDRPQYCKTEYQPYDRMVCAILSVAAEYAGSCFVITSDGNRHHWTPYIEWASTVLARPVPNPIPA